MISDMREYKLVDGKRYGCKSPNPIEEVQNVFGQGPHERKVRVGTLVPIHLSHEGSP